VERVVSDNFVTAILRRGTRNARAQTSRLGLALCTVNHPSPSLHSFVRIRSHQSYPTMYKLAIASLLATSAAAFAPAQSAGRASTSLNLNGWVADEVRYK